MRMNMTLEERLFFDARPEALPLYEALREALSARVPELAIEPRRTQLSLRRVCVFGAVSFAPVRRAAERPPAFLTVTFGLPAPLASPRIDAVSEAAPGRWTHHVTLGTAEEIDEELLTWLEQAAVFASLRRPRKR